MAKRSRGCIEWYDRRTLKVRGRDKVLIYKSAIKYMYKAGRRQQPFELDLESCRFGLVENGEQRDRRGTGGERGVACRHFRRGRKCGRRKRIFLQPGRELVVYVSGSDTGHLRSDRARRAPALFERLLGISGQDRCLADAGAAVGKSHCHQQGIEGFDIAECQLVRAFERHPQKVKFDPLKMGF